MIKIELEVVPMGKDYREKFEEHRQSIEVDKPNSRMTRSKRHSVSTTKKRKFPLMTILTVILIFIPLLFLIYVWGFYTPDETEVAKDSESGSVVQLEKNNTVSASNNDKEDPVVVDDEDESKSDDKQTDAAKYQAAKEKKAAKEAAKIVAQKEKAKAEVEKARELEKQKQAEKEKQLEEEQKEQKVHTVGANENLFRIALKYYNGDPNGVQKIKDANNLSSDSISVGQQLIIP